MHSLTLTTDNRAEIAASLAGPRWTVACLCALWCGTCATYRATFEQLAERHPEAVFVWIDIEEEAAVVGDLDIDNFPTLLIQQEDNVAFFGTVLPDGGLAHRMLQAQQALSAAELAAQANSSEERRHWQRECNLRTLLAAAEA